MHARQDAAAGWPGWARGCLVLTLLGVALVLVVNWLGRGDGGGAGAGPRVGLLRVEGEIESSRSFLEELDRLETDRRVRALVLRIDSPGGSVAATQEMFDGVERYRRRTGRPVVASFGGLAASGGYYLGCAAERILCEPGTLTGSIGVLLVFTDASELLRKIGVRVEVVKSGARKDLGQPWRGLSDEERRMLDAVVADAHAQFTEAVARSRGLEPAQIQSIADGRVLTGRQALAEGLVDSLGFEPDAVRLAAGLAGLPPDTPVLSHERWEPDWLRALRRLSGALRAPGVRGARLEYR